MNGNNRSWAGLSLRLPDCERGCWSWGLLGPLNSDESQGEHPAGTRPQCSQLLPHSHSRNETKLTAQVCLQVKGHHTYQFLCGASIVLLYFEVFPSTLSFWILMEGIVLIMYMGKLRSKRAKRPPEAAQDTLKVWFLISSLSSLLKPFLRGR